MKTTVGNSPSVAFVFLSCALLLPAAASAQFNLEDQDDFRNLIFEAAWISQPDTVDTSAAASIAATETQQLPANSSLSIVQSMADYEAAITTALEDEGLYSEKVREDYQALGLLQQQAGQHETAISTFENAIHIARVNDGLFTLAQVNDIKNIISSQIALGDEKRETEYRNSLFTIYQKSLSPGDPQLLAAMGDWANWNLKNYGKNIASNPRSIKLKNESEAQDFIVIRDAFKGQLRFIPAKYVSNQSYFSGSNGYAADSRYSLLSDMVVDERLDIARDTFNDILEDGDSSLTTAEKDSIQLQLVAAEYSLKHQMDLMLGIGERSLATRSLFSNSERDINIVKRGYRESLDRLQDMIDQHSIEPVADPQALAKAWLNMADYLLAYKQTSKASTAYQEAWQLMAKTGLDNTQLQQFFAPDPLTPVPAFAILSYSRKMLSIPEDDLIDYRGYIDAKLDVSRNGNVRGLKVTQESEGTPYRVRTKLLDYLKSQIVRPAILDGNPVKQEDLYIRFYYTY